MVALLIILSVALLIFLALMLNCHLRIQYLNGELTARLTLLGIVLQQFPKKPKCVRLSDYTPRKIKKRREKAKRRREKLIQKKRAERQQSGSSKPKDKPEDKKDKLLKDITSIRHLLVPLLRHGAKRVRLYAKRIRIVVSAEDAATTAILYGAITPAVALLLDLLDQFKKVRKPHNSEIAVIADFTAGECTAEIDIFLSLHLYQVISILLHTFFQYTKSQMESEEKKKEKSKKKNPSAGNHKSKSTKKS